MSGVLMIARRWWFIISTVLLLCALFFGYVFQPWIEPFFDIGWEVGWYKYNEHGQPDLSQPDRFGPALTINATTEKRAYLSGEEIEIDLSFKNADDEPITVSPFPPDIKIFVYWHSEDGAIRSLVAGNQELKLKPGKSFGYTFFWDQKDNSKQQVEKGWYEVEVNCSAYISGKRFSSYEKTWLYVQ